MLIDINEYIDTQRTIYILAKVSSFFYGNVCWEFERHQRKIIQC